MKQRVRVLTLALLYSLVAVFPRAASADAGDAGDAGADGATWPAGGWPDDGGGDGGSVTPLACDGSLCDTTNQSTCTTGGRPGGPPMDAFHVLGAVTTLVGVLTLAIARRRRAERVKP